MSHQLRFAYFALLAFLFLAGLAFIALGIFLFVKSWESQFKEALSSAIVSLSVGALLVLIAFVVHSARRYLIALKETTATTIASEEIEKKLAGLKEGDFEGLDRALLVRQRKAELDFERNLQSIFTLEEFTAQGITLFRDLSWNLQPGINVLLGRNGYGKSLILRALAGAIQRDEESTKKFFEGRSDSSTAAIEVRMKRDGERAHARRDAQRFSDSMGKVPLLAIPDSRFFDRSQTSIVVDEAGGLDLPRDGAYHFLNQLHYGPVIQGLLGEICLDYMDHGKSFNLPVFRFLRTCVTRLTGYTFDFYSIERQGRTGFKVQVVTEGNEGPLPIQYASQGTLSVIAMLGLIRSYISAISGQAEDQEGVQRGAGIVLIDEADAHLHPAWQQKLPTLLRQMFPHVQFILSAHSPLFVAGCWNGEVAILRRQGEEFGGGFTIEQPNRDFIGVKPADLYEQIFDIEELDGSYLEYSQKASQTSLRADLDREVATLAEEQKSDPSAFAPAREEQLSSSVEESRRIRLVEEVTRQRRSEITKEVQIAQKEVQIAKQQAQIAEQQEQIAQLQAHLSKFESAPAIEHRP
ncbi:MAG TPA: AAA family ATPase [Chthoniobacterales bacterium]|nr:AAA family ATPase [Chthoniobacterales bacterium]